MKKPLVERFQQLAGIKPLYEQAKKPNLKSIVDIDRSDWTPDGGGSIGYMEWEDGTEMTPQEIQDYFEINHELYDDIMQGLVKIKDLGSENGEIRIKLKDLTFDAIKKAFPNNYQKEKFTRPQTDEPYYEDAISFPNLDDSSMEIGDSSALEDYKNKIERFFGNVTVVLKPDGKNWFDKVFIDDEKFNQSRDQLMRGKASAMKRDQELGRSID